MEPKYELQEHRAKIRRLVELGLAIIPLHTPTHGGCSCKIPACSHPGKHPRITAWQKTAHRDTFLVDLTWSRFPDANVGVLTLDLFILDVDPRSGGNHTLDALLKKHGVLPRTWEVRSGGGGTHYWFQLPEGVSVKHGANKLGPGLDVKAGPGCYIIAPPSLHESGNRYTWTTDPESCGLALPPDWMITPLMNEDGKSASGSSEAPIGSGDGNIGLCGHLLRSALRQCNSGSGRHDAAFWLACQLRDNRFSFPAAEHAMAEFVNRCPASNHPFPLDEGVACLEQAYRREPREPWQVCKRIPVFRKGIIEYISTDAKADARRAK